MSPIHFISEGLDKGDIIVQKEVFFNSDVETLKSSYDRLNGLVKKLFKSNWEKISQTKLSQ